MRRLLPWILSLLVALLFLATGCEDEEGILQQFAGKRLGLILETVPSSYEPGLETRLINYIKKRIDLQVINPKLVMDDGPYPSRMVEDFCRDELGLDLLLTIKLTDIMVNEPQPNVKVRPHRVAVEVSASCSLTLLYTLRDLLTDQILYFGQSNGSAKATNRVKASEGGVHFDFKEFNPYELIEDAMLDALRNTDLL